MRSPTIHRNKKLFVCLVAGAAAALTSTLAAPAAHAVTTEWSLGYSDGSVASTGDVIINSGTATVSFSGLYNGIGAMVICNIPEGEISYMVPATVPSALPNHSFAVQLTPPASLTSGECHETVTPGTGAVNVTIDTTKTWTLTVTAPMGSGPTGAYSGTLTGSLNVPQGGITNVTAVELAGLGLPATNPCIISGPTDVGGVTPDGDYDASTGIAVNTTNPTFHVDNSLCPEINNNEALGDIPTLNTASVTLRKADPTDPMQPTSLIPTAVWQ